MKDVNTSDERHLLSTLGLCRRAGGLISGTPMVCNAMREKKGVLAVIEAADTSENTHEKLSSKCAFYQVPLYRISVSTQDLARAIGKSGAVAAVGIIHEGLMTAIQKHLSRNP
ncbi:MAG: hypothetical protein E7645_00170 [Ruminococcaceae bacterium]|nr:hypothetical protein [Oscillospiraceae bacterium]